MSGRGSGVTSDERIAAALERLADTWQEQIAESKAHREALENFEWTARKKTAPSFMERQTIALERIATAIETYPEPA